MKYKEIKAFLKKVPKSLAENSFLTIMSLFLISLVLGGLIFYKYVVLTEKKEIKSNGESIQFEKETYENILNIWQTREDNFKKADAKKYYDPFKID